MTNTNSTRSWKKSLIIGAVALSTIAGAGFTAAQARGWGEGRGNGDCSQMQDGGKQGQMRKGHGKFGQMQKGGQQGFSEQRLESFLTMIEATPEQKEKITEIFKTARETMQTRRDNRSENQAEMRKQVTELLKAPEFDREAAANLMEGRDSMREDGRATMQTAMLDAVEVLTPEQRTKIADFIAKRGGMFFGQGHGPRN